MFVVLMLVVFILDMFSCHGLRNKRLFAFIPDIFSWHGLEIVWLFLVFNRGTVLSVAYFLLRSNYLKLRGFIVLNILIIVY